MAIQEKLSPEQQVAYEAFKCAVNSLRQIADSLNIIEEELGVDLQLSDFVDMYDPTDDSVESFLDLIREAI